MEKRIARPRRRAVRKDGGFHLVMFEKSKKADILERSGELICQAHVNVSPMGSILFVIPRSATYKAGGNYHVVFYDPVLGRVTCRCRLSTAIPLPGGELCSLRCEILEQVAQVQQRQDVKVPLGATIMLHAVYQPGDVGRLPEGGSPATIVDISAGGVYLRTPMRLERGRRVWFDFMVGQEKMTLSAQILRADSAVLNKQQNQLQFGYGCKFVDLLSKHESILRSYIFQLQRQQRDRGQ